MLNTPRTPADVLDAAADLIQEHGLAKGEYHNSLTGTFCSLGAINHVTNNITIAHKTGEILASTITFSLPYKVPHIIITEWNDKPTINKAHVISKMRATARKWRKENPYD